MTDWYFAGMFDETFWAQVEKQRFTGRGAAEVLRQLIAEAGDGDLTWLSRASMLDALCRAAFEIKRRSERVQWLLNPFRDRPEEWLCRHGEQSTRPWKRHNDASFSAYNACEPRA